MTKKPVLIGVIEAGSSIRIVPGPRPRVSKNCCLIFERGEGSSAQRPYLLRDPPVRCVTESFSRDKIKGHSIKTYGGMKV